MVEIRAVRSRRDLEAFIDAPNLLYRGDPCYVPALRAQAKTTFDRRKYPLFAHSEGEFFVALEGGRPAGRIVAFRNVPHLERTGDGTGFFGFFESVEDFDVTRKLFDAAVGWLAGKGLTSVVGPENYTTNEACGLLIDGFDDPPVVMMPYNKPYYADFFERYGFRKELDLVSYRILQGQSLLDDVRETRLRLERRLARQGITVGRIDMKRFDAEIEAMRLAYNRAFHECWGFIPISAEEFRYYAKDIRRITGPEMMLLAKRGDETIGLLCVLPDINQVLIKIKDGRLLPFGIFRLLFGRKKIRRVRLLIFGVVPEYRNRGIDLCLASRLAEYATAHGFNEAEAGYVMGNNLEINSFLPKIGGQVRKGYRIYRFDILPGGKGAPA
jgi:GNAT superfamily N-acetyltransferase